MGRRLSIKESGEANPAPPVGDGAGWEGRGEEDWEQTSLFPAKEQAEICAYTPPRRRLTAVTRMNEQVKNNEKTG